jgi:hypothetical protein
MAELGADDIKATYSPDKKQRIARLKRYRQQIETSMKWRKDNFDQTWRDMIDLYKNKILGDDEDFDDNVSLAIGFSTINVIYPSVSLNRPKVTLTPNKPEMIGPAQIAEAVVNYWWKHWRYQEEFRAAVKDYLIIGHGWVKTTYALKESDVEMGEDERYQELVSQLSQKYEAIELNPQDANLFPTDQEIADLLPTTRKLVTEDHPVVERVSPWDIIIDPDATRDQDLTWIAQRIAVPKAEARERKDWNQSVLRDVLDAAQNLKESEGHYDDQVDKDGTFVIIYEHYDLKTGYLCTFAEHGEDFLVEPKKIPFPFPHPFICLRNYEVPEQFYPIGELEMIEPLIQAESRILTRQLNDVAQFTRKFGTKEQWLGTRAVDSLKSTADAELVFFSDEAPEDLRQALVALPTMGPQPEMYQMTEVLKDNETRVSAVNEYMQGALPEIRRTATEAGIIADASNARAAEKLAQIELAVAAVARRVLQLGQTYLTTEQVAAVFTEDPSQETTWVDFSRDQIQGEYDFDVEAGSTQPRNETFRRQSALQMMDAFSNPLFQPQQTPDGQIAPIIDARKLAAYVLQEGFGVKNAAQFIVPEPPPMAVDPMTGQPMPPGMPPGGEGTLPPGQTPPSGPPAGPVPPVA